MESGDLLSVFYRDWQTNEVVAILEKYGLFQSWIEAGRQFALLVPDHVDRGAAALAIEGTHGEVVGAPVDVGTDREIPAPADAGNIEIVAAGCGERGTRVVMRAMLRGKLDAGQEGR